MRVRRKQRIQKGRRQVQRERCRLAPGEGPSRPRADAVDMGPVIGRVMEKLGLDERHWLSELQEQWPLLVGPAVAKHARPGSFEHGTLVVFVDSSPWLSELSRYARSEMLSKVRERFGPSRVHRIMLRLDPEQGGGRVR